MFLLRRDWMDTLMRMYYSTQYLTHFWVQLRWEISESIFRIQIRLIRVRILWNCFAL